MTSRILNRRLARLRRNERGGASVEFVVVALMLFSIIFTMVESGVLMARSVMLEMGVNQGIRGLRWGDFPPGDHEAFKEAICEGAFLIGDCTDSIEVEVRPFEDAGAFVSSNPFTLAPQCRDRAEEPPETNPLFGIGAPNRIMFVRVCLKVNPIFPGIALGASMTLDANGDYAIVKRTAFMREPS